MFLSWAHTPESHFKVNCQNCHCVSRTVIALEARSVVRIWTFHNFICTLCLFLDLFSNLSNTPHTFLRINSSILLNLQAVYLQHLFSNFQIICLRRKKIYTFYYLFGGLENILKWHCRKTFFALVVLQFDGSCYVYVDAKQYHLAWFSTCNSTLNTSFR